jgi:thiol-disulfide isomerase/thioredoxin
MFSSPAARRTAAVVLLLAALMLPVILRAQGRPFELEGLQDGSLTPADFAQGVVIVVVWASWSPQCRNIDSRVEAIAKRWGSQARVIMVNFQEDRSEVEAFLGSRDSRVPVYLDTTGGFSKKYSVTNLPGLLIFRDGKTAFSGKLSRDPNSIISQTLG